MIDDFSNAGYRSWFHETQAMRGVGANLIALSANPDNGDRHLGTRASPRYPDWR
jgi:hypothetical protein